MHITRVVTHRLLPDPHTKSAAIRSERCVCLCRYSARFVSVGETRNRAFSNEALIELATKIGMDSHGSITVDTNDTDIIDFLKRTKCI